MTPSTNQKQLTLFVTFTIDPAKIETWKEADRPACAAEPECLLFDVFQDPASPGTMKLVEV
jgi:quinol monooxygenase YgiN